MKLSQKLDALQEMAKVCAEEPNKQYVIELLAEHAEESEMTTELLAWAEDVLRAS